MNLWGFCTSAVVALGACSYQESEAPHAVLGAWVEQDLSVAPKVDLFSPPPYEGREVFAPFSPMRRWMHVQTRPSQKADLDGTSVLLLHGLDTVRYIGYLRGTTSRVALVDVAGEVHSVREGDRVGVEGARVRGITDEVLELYLPLNGQGAQAVAMPRLHLSKKVVHGKNQR